MNDTTVYLHVFDLDVPEAIVAACRHLIGEDEVKRADRFVRAIHRDRWIVAHAGMRTALAHHCHVDPPSLRFAARKNGKPCLEWPRIDSPLYFNLTHSGAVALLATTRIGPLGVDVEHMRDIADRDAVVERFFSRSEQSRYRQLLPHERRRAFYHCWTRKEAVIKATGEGLSADLGAFDVTLDPDGPAQIEAMRDDDARHWRLFHLEPRAGYVGAIALKCGPDTRVREVATKDFWLAGTIG